ncbi:MAG: MerR family transcriptional regulator [Deltaproteobacteria bacterium]|nr:MerR family transcriptional regulator [Deltaproteobacteria bacterium]
MQLKNAQPGELTIGKLSKELGIAPSTIHFYVDQGLLPRPRKLNRTRAVYGPVHLRRARLIKRLQAAGLPLAFIKGALERVGGDEAALDRLESVGYLQPLPRPRNDPEQAPIEPFEPVDRATFLELAHAPHELVERLEAWGLLRPRQAGRYDARDLWLVQQVQALLRDGLPLEELALQDHVLPLARAVSPLVMQLVQRHTEALAARRMRFSELLGPFAAILGYIADRTNDELFPGWRETYLWAATDGAAEVAAEQGASGFDAPEAPTPGSGRHG